MDVKSFLTIRDNTLFTKSIWRFSPGFRRNPVHETLRCRHSLRPAAESAAKARRQANQKDPDMSPETRQPSRSSRRLATREELTRFYNAIGIPAVVSATQASKMTGERRRPAGELPAFLRDAHAVG